MRVKSTQLVNHEERQRYLLPPQARMPGSFDPYKSCLFRKPKF